MRSPAERGLAIQPDVPLAPLTTLRVGGPAERLAAPESIDELVALLTAARDAGVEIFMLGKGSDLVVADAGIRGLVVRTRAGEVTVEGTRVRAEAGAAMAGLARRTAREGLAGFDWAISIPGSFGGAVWANAGAHGGEMKDVLVEVDVFDPATGERTTIAAADCAFRYRDSRFKHSGEVILGGVVELARGEPDAITRAHRRAPGAPPPDPAAGRPERRQRLPQPRWRPRRAADRGCRPEGSPDRERAGQHAARELHRHRSRLGPRRRRPCPRRPRAGDRRRAVRRRAGLRDRVRRRLAAEVAA